MRGDGALNYELSNASSDMEWSRLGLLSGLTPANVKKIYEQRT
jgi:hypothetical protein